MPEIAALTLADSYMSLVYHRGGIKEWNTIAAPRAEEWQLAMDKCRRASNQVRGVLNALGVDQHVVAREMHRQPWERV